MSNVPLIIIEIVSAIICFVLVWFMMKPYHGTGERRYLGLPLGFAFLGVAYVLTSTTYFESFPLIGETRWLRLFTQTYAFAFLAVTYYFSGKPSKNSRLWSDLTYAGLILLAIISYLIVVEPLIRGVGLPSYKIADQYLLLFNLFCLAYISFHTLRSHGSRPDPKTIWIPLSYLLLGFGQYSLFIDSFKSNQTSAIVGAQILRLSGLLILLFVSIQVFYSQHKASEEERMYDEEASSQG